MMTNDITRNRDIPPGETTGGARLRINLGKEAVKLALSGDWERAVEVNRAILDLLPQDCETGNRLAKALMELGELRRSRLCPRGAMPTFTDQHDGP